MKPIKHDYLFKFTVTRDLSLGNCFKCYHPTDNIFMCDHCWTDSSKTLKENLTRERIYFLPLDVIIKDSETSFHRIKTHD